jgi:NodT family efflux transporter outer membrane factor (OMF) lipoprotein
MRQVTAVLVVASIVLNGCADYSGLHSESVPIVPKAALVSDKIRVDPRWWTMFGDKQLDALIEEALVMSPDIKTAEARVRLSEKEAALAGASLKPSLSVNGQAERERISANGYFPPPIGGSTINFGQLTMDFDYEFDWWGRNHAALRAALSEVGAGRAEAREARLILGTAIANCYFRLQSNLARLDIAKQVLKTRTALAQLSKIRATDGLDSDFRWKQDESNAATAQLEQAQLEELIHLDRIRIAALMGRETEVDIEVSHPSSTVSAMPSSIPADLIGMRPDVQAQRMRIDAALSRTEEAKAEFYPNIDLAASVGYQAIGFGNLLHAQSEMASFGPALHLPIFNGGSLRANLGIKLAEYDIAVEEYNQMVVNAMRDVSQASTSLSAIREQSEYQDRVVAKLEEAYRIALARYKDGISDETAVLEADVPMLYQKRINVDLDQRRHDVILEMIQALGGAPSTSQD